MVGASVRKEWNVHIYVNIDKCRDKPKWRLKGRYLSAGAYDIWGRSSVGRAPEWHSGGQGFEPPRLHQFIDNAGSW